MKNGTNINEITESLPNGIIIRLIGNGWRPRSHSIELINPKNERSFKISSYDDILYLYKKLEQFIKQEKEQDKLDIP